MADIYLRSADGSDASDGLTWANAKATLGAAVSAAGSGGRVFMADGHAESTATTINITAGTAASPVQVLCVVDTGDPEPPTALATTGSVTTTGSASINLTGFYLIYGVNFNVGDGANTAIFKLVSTSPLWARLVDCTVHIANTSVASYVGIGDNSDASDDRLVEFVNTTVRFGHVDQNFRQFVPFRWLDTPSGAVNPAGSAPTLLFNTGGSGLPQTVRCRGLDLSALGSGKTLVNVSATTPNEFLFENCKLGSSVSVTTGSVAGQGGTRVRLINCDSADTNYRYHQQSYQGTVSQETTIVRTGGASDGTTPHSVKMVTTANAKVYSPLEGEPIIVWNETTGSAVTATVEVVTDNVTLTDKEAWVEVEYLGTSGFPLGSFADDRATDNNTYLGSGTNQTTSSAAWTTTGLTTPVKQKLAVSFTPQEKGPFRARVMLARASTTMYYCPKVDVS